MIDFCMDSLAIFLRFGTPTWSYLGPKTRPRRLQDASKTAPKRKCAAFFAPMVIMIDFWSTLDRFSMDFRNDDFGRFLVEFHWTFGRYSHDFALLFGRFLVDVLIVFK